MTIQKYILFIFSLLLLTACDNEERWLQGDLVPAVFAPGFAGELEAGDTRATNNTWTADDRVGIYMLNGSNYTLTSALKKNIEYKATASTSSTLTPVAAANTIYYPVNGSAVRFVAYSPYLSSATSDNQAVYTFTTQNTKVLKEGKDFLFYRGTTNRSKTNATETMTFKHKFSKINITVKQGTNGPSCSGLTMTLTKMPLSATVNLATLASSEANENAVAGLGISTSNTTISAYTSASTTASASVEAIVAPHTGAGNFTGRTFTFSAGGYTYSLPDNVTFEAGKVYNFSFTLTQTAAVLNEVDITDWSVGEVQWNKDYALATSTSELKFQSDASSQTLYIRTKGATTAPTINRSTSSTNATAGAPAWLTGASFGTASTSGDWTVRTMTVTVTANTTTTDRTGYIHVSFQGVRMVIGVTQSKTTRVDGNANCFIVAPGTTILIPMIRPVTYGGATATTFTATKLWDDTTDGAVASYSIAGTGQDALLTVTAGTKSGNALIAVKQGGETKWSYHIWVTDYDTSKAGATWTNSWNTNNNGKNFVFMDRNLGATFAGLGSGAGTGLFYQWGRKDPFPATGDPGSAQPGGGTFNATSKTTTTGTLDYTRKNPNDFIVVPSGGSDYSGWLSTGHTDLWAATASDTKTVYDPCPKGWRVPAASDQYNGNTYPWTGCPLTSINGGYQLGVNCLFPDTKTRLNSTGEVYGASATALHIGGQGMYLFLGENAWRTSSMWFNREANTLNTQTPKEGSFIGCGLVVRCTKEN